MNIKRGRELYSRKKREGQYFEIDAIVAIGILIVGLIYIRNLNVDQPISEQISRYSQESVKMLATLKVSDLNQEEIAFLSNSTLGIYTNANNTIAKQIGVYILKGEQDLAQNLTRSILDSLIPPEYGYSVVIRSDVDGSMNESTIYNRTSPRDEQDIRVSKTMITGLQQTKPVIGKFARIYLGNPKTNLNKYVFFGGYVGQGDISFKIELPSNFKQANEINFEGYVGADISVKVNNNECSQISKTEGGKSEITEKKLACTDKLAIGTNNISFEFDNAPIYDQYIGGGFLEVIYSTDEYYIEPESNRIYLPGIKGRINIFDSVFFDGNLFEDSFKINLSFNKTDNLPIVFNFENETIYQIDVIGQHEVLLDKNSLSLGMLSRLANKNIPFRFGTLDILMANSDIAWLTDRSSTIISTNLDLVKSYSKKYAQEILEYGGNNISLIGYGTVSCGFRDFTGNSLIVNSTIDPYIANCGNTCIGCAMWKAMQAFNNNSLAPIASLPGDLDQDLVSWWRMDDTNQSLGTLGAKVIDYTGKYNGTASGNSAQIEKGYAGKGFEFKGDKDYITAPSHNFIDKNEISVSAWVKTRNATKKQNIVDKNGPFFLRIQNSKANGWIHNGTWTELSGNTILKDNQWYHLTLTYDANNIRLYVNGKEENNISKTGNLVASNALFIGHPQAAGGNDSFVGTIDEVMIWNRTLSPDEINDLYEIEKKDKYVVLIGDKQADYVWNELDQTSSLDTVNAPLQAVDYAQQACVDNNITLLTVGFGSLAGAATLQSMAEANKNAGCGGMYFQAADEAGLDKALEDVSTLIKSRAQSISDEGGSSDNALSGESYIEFETSGSTISIPASSTIFMSKTARFGEIGENPCNVNIDLSGFNKVTEARLTSYSSDLWTSKVRLDGDAIFNLAEFGQDFKVLGDPFNIHIPYSKLSTNDGIYDISMQIGETGLKSEGCSNYNRMIYTAYLSREYAVYSEILEKAEGCAWNISFSDGSNKIIKVPYDYKGTKKCNYTTETMDNSCDGATSPKCKYDDEDALDIITYGLLNKLDVDKEGDSLGKVEISISQEDLEVDTQTIQQIPFLWGPAILEVRVWK